MEELLGPDLGSGKGKEKLEGESSQRAGTAVSTTRHT